MVQNLTRYAHTPKRRTTQERRAWVLLQSTKASNRIGLVKRARSAPRGAGAVICATHAAAASALPEANAAATLVRKHYDERIAMLRSQIGKALRLDTLR